MRKQDQAPGVLTRRAACAGATATMLCAYPPLADASERGLDTDALSRLVDNEIAARRIPGAVILIGRRDDVLWRYTSGSRVLGANPAPMTADTIFDLASLTKPVATATAIMQLVDGGAIQLDMPASRYWPEFGRNGKDAITIRQLLTHYSGLRADMDLSQGWTGHDPAMAMIAALSPIAPPGEAYLYSDIGYLTLGEIVQRVAMMPFDAYCAAHIFAPLGMTDTLFRPQDLQRVAPTQDIPGHPHWGDAHDATTRWMGGVSGSAGLFSTADDLGKFVRMLLHRGSTTGAHILNEQSAIRLMTRQTRWSAPHARTLGFEVGGSKGLALFPANSFGHLGFTGGMIWANPRSEAWVIALTHRVYPDGSGDATALRRGIMSGVRSISS